MKRLNVLLIPFLFAAFAFVVLLPFFNGHWQLADDAYYLTLPDYILKARILAEGMWPHYNLNVALGQPMATAMGSGLFYPGTLLWGWLVGWTETTYLWFLFAHLVLGGCLAFGAGRKLGLSQATAAFSSLAYIGNGFVIGSFSNPSILLPFLFWPLIIWGLKELHTPKAPIVAATWKLALGLILVELTGYPLIKLIIFLMTFLGYWALVRKPGTLFQGPRWKPVFLSGVSMILITAPEWVPTLRVVGSVDRVAGAEIYDQSLFHNVSNLFQLATLFLPGQFLQRDQYQIGIMHLERSWWVGILTIGLVPFAFFRNLLPLRQYKPIFLLLFIAFLFSIGGHSFFRELSSTLVPILKGLRHSHMARICITAFLCFLAGKVLTEFEKQANQEKPSRALPFAWGIFLLLATAFAVSENSHELVPNTLYTDSSSGWKIELLHHAFYLVIGLTLFLKWRTFFTARQWIWALVALQFVSLADVGYGYRKLIGRVRTSPIQIVEKNFKPVSPQPNERSIVPAFTGTDWYQWTGNRKILNAYFPPSLEEFNVAKKDPRIAPLLDKLISCSEMSQPCIDTRFQIDYHFGNKIHLSGVTGKSPAQLLVHNLFSKDWHGELNGVEVPITRALDHFMAMEVPAGTTWKIILEYRDPYFPWLGWISASGLLLLILLPSLLKVKVTPQRAVRVRARN